MSIFGKMKDLYHMQKEAKRIKEKLKKTHIEAEISGITVTINGEQEVIAIAITDEAIKDKNKLEINLKEAFNKAIKKSQQIGADEMKGIMGDMGLPGNFGAK